MCDKGSNVMDKSRITVTIRPQMGADQLAAEEKLMHARTEWLTQKKKSGRYASRRGKKGVLFPSWRSKTHQGKGTGPSWKDVLSFSWKPLFLATLIGTVLGLGILFTFKEEKSAPAGTVLSGSSQGQAQFPGVSLFLCQVGVYEEKAAAQRAQASMQAKGISPVLRGGQPFALIAAVAPDQQTGQTAAERLRQRDVPVYNKRLLVPSHQGTIPGLTAEASAEVAGYLQKVLPQAHELLQAMYAPAALPTEANGNKRMEDLQKSAQMVGELLRKAGKTADAVALSDMQSRLQQAYEAYGNGKDFWMIQGNLTAFYLTYEYICSQWFTST